MSIRSMDRRTRQKAIVESVNRSGIAGIGELAGSLSVAEITIRRDIQYLSSQGLVRKIKGGAQRCGVGIDSVEHTFRTRLRTRTAAKERLARKALEQIQPGDAVFFGASTTIVSLANLVAQMNPRITAFTNSLYTAIPLAAADNVDLIMMGGVLDKETCSCSSLCTADEIPAFNARIAFVSCTGFVVGDSTYDSSLANVPLKHMLTRSSARISLVLEASKLGHRALHRVIASEDLGSVITEAEAASEQIEAIRRQGLDLHLA